VDAVVFDLDGVIADSEGLHAEALHQVGRSIGLHTDLTQYIGWSDADALADMLAGAGTARPRIEDLLDAKSREYSRLLGRLRAFPGAAELVRACAQRWRVGLCTATLRHDAHAALERLGLAQCFHAMVVFEDAPQSKPDPAPYRLVAQRLGVAPNRCLAVEDSERGVASAAGAGLSVLAVGHTTGRERLDRAHAFVPSLAGLDADALESIARRIIHRRINGTSA